jgi:hypothetical protein
LERSFFRIVKNNPPIAEDFQSHKELGIPVRDPANYELWSGVSVYGTLHQARKKAKQYPSKGTYIAMLRIAEGMPLTFRRTGGSNHFTVWGMKEDLLQCVEEVVNVEDDEHE